MNNTVYSYSTVITSGLSKQSRFLG